MSVTTASVAAAREAGRTVDRLLERPRTVVGTLAGAQIALTLVLAIRVQHNGWVYFQGGDQILLTTTGWLLGQLQLPPAEISYLWPLLQAPITWISGPTFVQVLPALVVLNVIVLGPIGLLCVYGIASHIGGRLLGYWASFLWVIAPYAAIPLFIERYHEKWTEQFLPQATGLTAMADFPSMIAVLAAAYFVIRSLTPNRIPDAVLAGLLLGAAGGLKPPNFIMGFGAVLAYLVARRWRELVVFGAAIVPTLLVLAFWKERGLGTIPAFAVEQVRMAAGATAPVALSNPLHQYLQLDTSHWREQMSSLREFFWSARVAQWAPFAGLLAVLRVRRGAIACLLAGWLGAFILVKGFSDRASIEANTFWRLLMPAWPAYLLLFASIPLLVPTLRAAPRRQARRTRPVARALALDRSDARADGSRPGRCDGRLDADLAADAGHRAGAVRRDEPAHARRRQRRVDGEADWKARVAELDQRGAVASGCLLPRLSLRRPRKRPPVRDVEQRHLDVLPEGPARADDPRHHVRRPRRAAGRDLPDRRRDELGERPEPRRCLRVQRPPARPGR